MSLHHSRKPSWARACAIGAAFLGCLLALSAASSNAAPVADSRTQWSITGTQGENNWFNGYYNLTTDATPGYATTDFTAFLRDGTNVISATNHWNGSAYDLNPAASGPWTEQGQEAAHPNGTNSAPNQEHWNIRRWVSDRTAPLALTWDMRKTNLAAGGTGVTGILFVNGVQSDTWTIAPTDGVGVSRTFYANVNTGDRIDIALTPNGSDGSDGSAYGLRVNDTIPPNATQPPIIVANSGTEWSTTGTQGANGWFYGYYDVRFDAANDNDGYQPGDFQTFLRDGTNTLSATNKWDGTKYDLAASVAPWTELSQGGGHPAANGQGEPSVHWAVRRWVSDVTGPANVTGQFFQTAANGDGILGRIYLNGVEVYNQLSDFAPANFNLNLNLLPGDVLDFAADPNGARLTDINLMNDGSDGFTFNAIITGPGVPFVPIPEPSSVVMAALGGIGLLTLALRKRRR